MPVREPKYDRRIAIVGARASGKTLLRQQLIKMFRAYTSSSEYDTHCIYRLQHITTRVVYSIIEHDFSPIARLLIDKYAQIKNLDLIRAYSPRAVAAEEIYPFLRMCRWIWETEILRGQLPRDRESEVYWVLVVEHLARLSADMEQNGTPLFDSPHLVMCTHVSYGRDWDYITCQKKIYCVTDWEGNPRKWLGNHSCIFPSERHADTGEVLLARDPASEAILFMVDVASYGDNDYGLSIGLSSSIEQFISLMSHELVRRSAVVVVFSQMDRLECKLKTEPFERQFPDFRGDPLNACEVAEFIRKKFSTIAKMASASFENASDAMFSFGHTDRFMAYSQLSAIYCDLVGNDVLNTICDFLPMHNFTISASDPQQVEKVLHCVHEYLDAKTAASNANGGFMLKPLGRAARSLRNFVKK